jgi:hypothetical protein
MQVAWLWQPEEKRFLLVYLMEDGSIVQMGVTCETQTA